MNPTYIWGAGHYGVLTALDCEQKGVKVAAFIDGNASQIKTRLGLPVQAPNEIISNKQNCTIIIAVANENAIKQITETLLLTGLEKNKDFKISHLISANYGFSKNETFFYNQKGVCPICNENVTFYSENTWLRDFLKCSNCGSIPRQRALMAIIEKHCPNWRNLDIHESSPGNCSITSKLRECEGYICSQYYPNLELGKIINGYRNENLEEQTFKDKTFDIVITQDVFEHIYNPAKAFSEIARTLRGGGMHIFTVPIINKFNKTEVWAKMDANGEPLFCNTEEWHGNPINKKGSPVTMHWGYDIVGFIKEHSELETQIEYMYNLNLGIWAEYIEVLVSKKQ